MKWLLPALASVILWPLYLVLWVPVLILGVPLVAWLAYRRDWIQRPSKYFPETVWAWRPRWSSPWQNETDGVKGPAWYREKHPDRGERFQAWMWSAIRNPANGFRYISVIHPAPIPERIRFVGNSDDPTENVNSDGIVKRFQWAFTWQSLYAGFVFRWQITKERHLKVRLGYKFLPRDRFGLPDWDYRRVRMPFGIQVHVWRRS